jgi:hypothetical protein
MWLLSGTYRQDENAKRTPKPISASCGCLEWVIQVVQRLERVIQDTGLYLTGVGRLFNIEICLPGGTGDGGGVPVAR